MTLNSHSLAKTPDPIAESIGNLMVVLFPKSTSKNYPLAVNIAKGAHYFDARLIDGIPINYAVFTKNPEQAGRLQALLDFVSAWKGIQVFVDGRLEKDLIKINRVLVCYLKASACVDWRAHCFKVIDDPSLEKAKRSDLGLTIRITDKPPMPKESIAINQFTFPCSLIYHYNVFQANHPASLETQIQAEAVQFGANWCPFFEQSNFKTCGVRYDQREFFT